MYTLLKVLSLQLLLLPFLVFAQTSVSSVVDLAEAAEGDGPNEKRNTADESIATRYSHRSVQTDSCPFITWNSLVTLELVVPASSCYNQLSVTNTPTLTADLERAYVDAYTKLQNTLYDPYVRQLTSAKIVVVGKRNSLGNIPIEMSVSGTCGACSGLSLLAYDLPTNSTSIPATTTACSCHHETTDADARAPFEAEFIDEYQKSVQALNARCPVMLAECSYGTGFSTGVYTKVESDVDMTDTQVAAIGQAFMEATNIEYAVTQRTCNTDFREVERVTTRAIAPPTRRELMEDSSIPESTNDSDGRRLQKMRTRVLNLQVAGVCNDCKDKLFSTDKIGRRRLRIERRKLQWASWELSHCYCPLGSQVDVTQPTMQEMIVRFEAQLRLRNIPRWSSFVSLG